MDPFDRELSLPHGLFNIHALHSIRQLLASHQSSVLRKDEESQAVLINLILRNYIGHQLFDLAEKFALKITFPSHADNNQIARYMYYLGMMKVHGILQCHEI